MTTTLDKPGTVMPDGSVYAGVSPDTGRPMYATPKDAPAHCMFNEAADYAFTLKDHARKDWRIPTGAELNVLFQNRAAIGSFDTSTPRNASRYIDSSARSANWAGAYWSSARGFLLGEPCFQRFGDGAKLLDIHFGCSRLALRCVRG